MLMKFHEVAMHGKDKVGAHAVAARSCGRSSPIT